MVSGRANLQITGPKGSDEIKPEYLNSLGDVLDHVSYRIRGFPDYCVLRRDVSCPVSM